MRMRVKWLCNNCGLVLHGNDFLVTDHPFQEDEMIIGCPGCKEIDNFVELCDEQGCQEPATVGFKSKFGYYRRVCNAHSEANMTYTRKPKAD